MHDKVTRKNSAKLGMAKFIITLVFIGVLGGLGFAGYRYSKASQANDQSVVLETEVIEVQPVPEPAVAGQEETATDQQSSQQILIDASVQPTSMLDVSPQQAAKLQELYVAIDKIAICNACADKANQHTTQVRNAKASSGLKDQVADGFKSLVKISKRDNPNGLRPAGNLELGKIQLKLLVNDMRWAWLYRDQQTYIQDINAARTLLQRDFDMQDNQVQVVANLLSELNTL